MYTDESSNKNSAEIVMENLWADGWSLGDLDILNISIYWSLAKENREEHNKLTQCDAPHPPLALKESFLTGNI